MVSLLQRVKTIYCLQVHDILWNHRIIEEKKILLYSWHSLTVGIGEAFWLLLLTLESMNLRQRSWHSVSGIIKSKISKWKRFRSWFCISWGCSIKWWQIKAGKHTHYSGKTEMQRLCLLVNQCKEMEAFSQAYQEETFIRLVEWAESQSHQWLWGCVQDLNTTSAVFCWCGWENVRHPSSMCQLPNCCADGSCPSLVAGRCQLLECWADGSHSNIVSRCSHSGS